MSGLLQGHGSRSLVRRYLLPGCLAGLSARGRWRLAVPVRGGRLKPRKTPPYPPIRGPGKLLIDRGFKGLHRDRAAESPLEAGDDLGERYAPISPPELVRLADAQAQVCPVGTESRSETTDMRVRDSGERDCDDEGAVIDVRRIPGRVLVRQELPYGPVGTKNEPESISDRGGEVYRQACGARPHVVPDPD